MDGEVSAEGGKKRGGFTRRPNPGAVYFLELYAGVFAAIKTDIEKKNKKAGISVLSNLQQVRSAVYSAGFDTPVEMRAAGFQNMAKAHGKDMKAGAVPGPLMRDAKDMYDAYLQEKHGDVLNQEIFQGDYWAQQEKSAKKAMEAAHEPWMSNLRSKPRGDGGAAGNDSENELDDVKEEGEQEVKQEVQMMRVLGYQGADGTYVPAGGAGGAARSSSIEDLSGKGASDGSLSRDPSPPAELPVQVKEEDVEPPAEKEVKPPAKKARGAGGAARASSTDVLSGEVAELVPVKQKDDEPPAKKPRGAGGAADSSPTGVQFKKDPDAPSEHIEPGAVVPGTRWVTGTEGKTVCHID
jgi:hypothetical protein